ncbi:hypothetical protein Asch02_00854 [Acinetobacter schindleri]
MKYKALSEAEVLAVLADKYGQPHHQELVAANSDALSGRISGGDW